MGLAPPVPTASGSALVVVQAFLPSLPPSGTSPLGESSGGLLGFGSCFTLRLPRNILFIRLGFSLFSFVFVFEVDEERTSVSSLYEFVLN